MMAATGSKIDMPVSSTPLRYNYSSGAFIAIANFTLDESLMRRDAKFNESFSPKRHWSPRATSGSSVYRAPPSQRTGIHGTSRAHEPGWPFAIISQASPTTSRKPIGYPALHTYHTN
jgi:hypothetical protein